MNRQIIETDDYIIVFQFHGGLTEFYMVTLEYKGWSIFQFHGGLTPQMVRIDRGLYQADFQFHGGLTEGFYTVSYHIFTLLLYKFFCA